MLSYPSERAGQCVATAATAATTVVALILLSWVKHQTRALREEKARSAALEASDRLGRTVEELKIADMGGMRVLVATERTADQRKTLAAVRSLARAGARVTVGSDRGICQPAWSRFCRKRVTYPSPVDDVERYAAALQHLLENDPHDVLLPLSDYTTLAAADHHEALSRLTHLPIPDRSCLTTAYDKKATLDAAVRVGIAIPQTHCPTDEADVERISRQIEYPCVLKLRSGAGGVGMHFPRDAGELIEAYRAPRPSPDALYAAAGPLIQERIPGAVHDVCLLLNRGSVRAAMTQQRLLMYPAAGGVGIYDRTTDEPDLRDQAVALLESLAWHGPAMVEFRHDERDGRFKLMEINARYWGTLDVAIQAGIDFPTLACRMMIEGDIPPVLDYTKSLEYRWLMRYGWLHAAESYHRWRTLWRWFRPARGRISEVWWTDPMPHVAEFLVSGDTQ